MDKLPKVEYDLEFGTFDDDGGQCPNFFQETLYTKENRPLDSIDAIFERKMSKRLSKFHAKPIDRTQYDKEMISKQLDLEIIKIYITIQDDSVK